MKTRSIVIVGAGIGGLTLARFLARDGHRVIVLERAKDFSAQGHSIGFRGIGFQVLELLGLRDALVRAGRDYGTTRAFTLEGKALRTMSQSVQAKAVGGVAVTQRGKLHAVLAEGLPPQIELRFGVQVTGLSQTDEAVTVELADGTSLEADIAVGADGANSAVRKMALPVVQVVDCGGVYAAMTIHTRHGLAVGEISSFYGVARLISFFPVDEETVAVVIYQDDQYPQPPNDNSAKSWKPYLQELFAGAAEPVRRIISAMKPTDEIYHDRIRRVPPQQLVAGRIVLLGDAGYCPTFFAGNGAGLAAAGAYCLARRLAANDDDHAALLDYEARITPFAAAYQVNANKLRTLLFSRSRVTVTLRRLYMRYAPPFVTALAARRHYRGDARIADLA